VTHRASVAVAATAVEPSVETCLAKDMIAIVDAIDPNGSMQKVVTVGVTADCANFLGVERQLLEVMCSEGYEISGWRRDGSLEVL
jgi:hypothetical protein